MPGLCAAFWLGLAGAAAAEGARGQLPVSPESTGALEATKTSEASESAERATKTLLHLRDGRVLRGKARPVENGWELRHGSDWLHLMEADVVRVVPERQALALARSLERDLRGETDPLRKLAHCDWLMHEGLYAEALERLDDLLDDHPDHEELLAFALEAPLPLALPPHPAVPDRTERPLGNEPPSREAVRYLSRLARLKSATQKERAIASLDEALQRSPSELFSLLRSELVEGHAARRTFAAHSLQRLAPGRAIDALLRRSLLDPSRDVRGQANRALRTADDAQALRTLVSALGSRHDVLRTNAVAALGDLGHPATVAPLIGYLRVLQKAGPRNGVPHATLDVGTWQAYVRDFEVEVAQGAAIADPQIGVLGAGTTLSVGVTSTSNITITRQRIATRAALERITGISPGRTTRAWLDWWDTNGSEWNAVHPPPADPSFPKTPGGG